MSIQAMVWVLDHSEAAGYERLVLLAIANHCDAFGCNAYPSYEQIAQEAHVDRGTVWRCLQRLAELGEVEVTKSGGGRAKRNQYRVPMRASEKPSRTATLSLETVAEGVGNSRGNRAPGIFNRPEQNPRVRVHTREGGAAPSPSAPPLGAATWEVPELPPAEVERVAQRIRALRAGEGAG